MGASAGKIRARGAVELLSAGSVVRTRVSGYFDEALCDEFISVVDQARVDRAGLSAFHDVTGVDDYDVAARERVSEWARAHASAFEGIHVLVERRTIAWALKIVGIAGGVKIVAYHSLADFEAAYDQRVRQGR